MNTPLAPSTQAFEHAARIACNKIMTNPDDMIDVPHPTLAGVNRPVPRWVSAAEQMVNLAVLMTSMQEAAMGQIAVSEMLRGMRK